MELIFFIILFVIIRNAVSSESRQKELKKSFKTADDRVADAKASVRIAGNCHKTVLYSIDSDLYRNGEAGTIRRLKIDKQNEIVRQKCDQKTKAAIEDANREYAANKEKYLALEMIEKCIPLEILKDELGARIRVTPDGIKVYNSKGDMCLKTVRFEEYRINPVEKITKRCALVYSWLDLAENSFYETVDENRECYRTTRRELLFAYGCDNHKEHIIFNRKVSETQYCMEEREYTVLEENFIPSKTEGIIRFERTGNRRSSFMDL